MSLLNKSRVKATALEVSKATGRKFERVSSEFVAHIEYRTMEAIKAAVHSHPSKGVTLKRP